MRRAGANFHTNCCDLYSQGLYSLYSHIIYLLLFYVFCFMLLFRRNCALFISLFVLQYTEKYKIDGRMIAIDFQKAFDLINRNFLYETLSAFGFGTSNGSTLFIRIFQVVCLTTAGFATGHFPIQSVSHKNTWG